MRLALSITVFSLISLLSAAQAQDDAVKPGLTSPPRVEHYDPLTDKFRYIESTLAPYHSGRLGGDVAYYGNRLRQYRYLGRPNTGGIYDAMQEYHRKVAPNPLHYQYRW